MKSIDKQFKQMVEDVPSSVKIEVDLSFAIADRINSLMTIKGLTKKEFALSLGKKHSEVTKWLSGQHNFTIRTLALLTNFFKEDIIMVRNT
jgi:antitoxin component HigA of HigAB toxin-antitoxin module